MPWPTNIDYQEAIQAPAVCFYDSELKTGTVETNNLGLPQPVSGNFASVYKIRSANRTYAVRCFLREFSDQKQRYQEISARLKTVDLPCMVNFEFVQNGIRVKGQWYPILKMEWIQGDLLHVFIRKNLNSPATLVELAKKWIELCKSLQQSDIAHGDFQHGNVI